MVKRRKKSRPKQCAPSFFFMSSIQLLFIARGKCFPSPDDLNTAIHLLIPDCPIHALDACDDGPHNYS